MARRRKSTLRNHFDWNDKLFMHFMRCYRISFALASPFWRSGKRTIIRVCFVICHAWIRYLCLLGVKCYFATILYWQGDGCIDEIHWSAENNMHKHLFALECANRIHFFYFPFIQFLCGVSVGGGWCFLYCWNVLHIAFNMSSFIHGSTSISSNQANAKQIHTDETKAKERTHNLYNNNLCNWKWHAGVCSVFTKYVPRIRFQHIFISHSRQNSTIPSLNQHLQHSRRHVYISQLVQSLCRMASIMESRILNIEHVNTSAQRNCVCARWRIVHWNRHEASASGDARALAAFSVQIFWGQQAKKSNRVAQLGWWRPHTNQMSEVNLGETRKPHVVSNKMIFVPSLHLLSVIYHRSAKRAHCTGVHRNRAAAVTYINAMSIVWECCAL